MTFLDELQKGTNRGVTENAAATNKSSLNANIDFFALAGAMRGRLDDAQDLFEKAYHSDPLCAVRTLFYIRDIRGGQGERLVFRSCMDRLKEINEDDYKKVLKHIPEYGRWDDMFGRFDKSTVEIVKSQLEIDESLMEKGEPVSLMAKWLPSENTSSNDTRARALKLIKELGLKPSQYRKKLSKLRRYIDLLEQKMSEKRWDDVDYEKIPSQALRKHIKAFYRNDSEKYSEYIEKVDSGEKKINVNTLYTYEVFDTVCHDEKTANVMWKNLPDYAEHDALVVADVSGSMSGRPMSISVSLALYFAERNKGLMKGYFMTFSDEPELIKVTGNTLFEKLRMIENSDWEMNTNLEAVFDTILEAAKNNESKNDDMPKVIYIISDMEFDGCIQNPNETLFENAKRKFSEAGFDLPHIVFWNVDARQNQAPATKFDNNVTLISGASQSTFRYAVEGKSPEEVMDSIINSERYSKIVL